MAAGVAGEGNEAQVDLARPGNARIERVADLAHAFLEADAPELDGFHPVGLAGRHLDLAPFPRCAGAP